MDATNTGSDLLETEEDNEVLQQTCPDELKDIRPEDVSQ